MQLNKIKKHTFAAFDSNGATNANDFMSDFKKYLEETLHLDKVTILGIASSGQDKKNVSTIFFAYVTPEVKKTKKEKKVKVKVDS